MSGWVGWVGVGVGVENRACHNNAPQNGNRQTTVFLHPEFPRIFGGKNSAINICLPFQLPSWQIYTYTWSMNCWIIECQPFKKCVRNTDHSKHPDYLDHPDHPEHLYSNLSRGVRQYSEQENTGGRQGGQSSLKPGIAWPSSFYVATTASSPCAPASFSELVHLWHFSIFSVTLYLSNFGHIWPLKDSQMWVISEVLDTAGSKQACFKL